MNTPDRFGEVLTTAWPVPQSRPVMHRAKPSWATMEETLRQWADDMKDELEMNYLPVNLEDVADKLASAHRWANEAREQVEAAPLTKQREEV